MKKALLFLLCCALAESTTINVTTSGLFHSCVPSGQCFINGSSVQWGTSDMEDLLSGLEFNGATARLSTDGSAQNIGELIHHNWPISGTIPELVGLNISIVSDLDSTVIPFSLGINETLNRRPCVFNSTIPCADRIRFITPFNLEYTFRVDETEYTLFIEGIKSGGKLKEFFITQEKQSTTGIVFARLIAVCASNATCFTDQCVLGECLEGFCQYNSTALNYQGCQPDHPPDLDPECYDTYCLDGTCEIDTEAFNNHTCNLRNKGWVFFDNKKCPGSCINGYCMHECESESSSEVNGDGGNDDGADFLPLLSLLSLSVLACLSYCFILLACLPLLVLPFLYFGIRKQGPRTYSAVSFELDPMSGSLDNPTFEESIITKGNPLHDNL